MPPPHQPSAWPFFPYEKIAESLASWVGDDQRAYRALRGVAWIATEKIHGANFCVVSDGAQIRCAKRKAYLDPDEDFFGHRALLERIAPRLLSVGAAVRARDPRVQLVFVHGELFGGGYPHPDVSPDPAVQPVQTGCWYSPTIEFCVFDLGVLRDGEEGRAYLDHDEATRVFTEAGIFHARPLSRGTYEDMITLPLGFLRRPGELLPLRRHGLRRRPPSPAPHGCGDPPCLSLRLARVRDGRTGVGRGLFRRARRRARQAGSAVPRRGEFRGARAR